jgi:hypothetical protein
MLGAPPSKGDLKSPLACPPNASGGGGHYKGVGQFKKVALIRKRASDNLKLIGTRVNIV